MERGYSVSAIQSNLYTPLDSLVHGFFAKTGIADKILSVKLPVFYLRCHAVN